MADAMTFEEAKAAATEGAANGNQTAAAVLAVIAEIDRIREFLYERMGELP